MTNPNDAARNQILRYFYNRNRNATSTHGKKGTHVMISQVKAELKSLHGYSQSEVMGNLTYLVDRGWVTKEETNRSFVTQAGTAIPSAKTWYVISALGIDKIEGESEFRDTGSFSGINIHASGMNVITTGNGNVVNATFKENQRALGEFRNAVIAADDLTDEQKLDIVADLISIEGQLAKGRPDGAIIQSFWTAIERVATGSAVAQLAMSIAPVILAHV